MITSNLVGGLGNYLFQIATTYSLSIDNDDYMVYNINDNTRIHNHISTYIKNIFRKINFKNNVLSITNNYEEPFFHYKPIDYKSNLRLNGYFQSEKYFIHNREKILNLFEIDDDTKDYLINKYGKILNENTCSIHVRRGDYLRLPNHHPVCDIEYYKKSVEIIGRDKHYLVFSDDMGWCKENLNFIDNKIFIENNTDFQDIYLMSMCKHNIIANSSFSWWGAWLNTNKDKKIIAPLKWFGLNNLHLNTNDLYCSNWIKL